MTPPLSRPRYTLIPRPEATADVIALAAHGPDVLAAAMAATDDLAHGRVVGKELGVRNVSGDLTGLARVKRSACPASGHSGSGSSAVSSKDTPARSSPSDHASNMPSTAWRPAASRRSAAALVERTRAATVPVDDAQRAQG